MLAELLGLPLVPAFSQVSGPQSLHGVNYASAAAGILDVTGRNFVSIHSYCNYLRIHYIEHYTTLGFHQVSRIPFNQQIRNFENTLDQISNNLGAASVGQSIGRCMFFVGMGSNDYLNNYLMPNYPTRNQYNAQQYADLLVSQYAQQLTVCISNSNFNPIN